MVTRGPGLAHESLCRRVGDHSTKKFSSQLVWLKWWQEGLKLPVATFATMSGKPTYRKAESAAAAFPISRHLDEAAQPIQTSSMTGKHGGEKKGKRRKG